MGISSVTYTFLLKEESSVSKLAMDMKNIVVCNLITGEKKLGISNRAWPSIAII